MAKSILRFTIAVLLAAHVAGAQAGGRAGSDSARADSARQLRAVTVTVTRSDDRAARLPWAIGVLGTSEIRRGQATLGIDEALNDVPGVVVSNRYIYALDQRLSIRGAGSRANFGTRGVKVLLDGVPQSLPDGQTQLTNVDMGAIGRVEVLRGAASSLYGNGSCGVISFETDMRAPSRLEQDARVMSGSFGLTKWQSRTVARTDRAIAMLSLSHTQLDGFRQYSAADVRDLNGAVDYALSGSSTLQLRASIAAVPLAKNPGALTAAEWDKNPDSAAATNVARGASREVAQHQYSIGWRHTGDHGDVVRAVAWYLTRTVDNALATTPPAPAGAANGTYNVIDRHLDGVRLDVTRALGDATNAPKLTVGFDAEHSHDDRRNWRSTGGRPVAAVDTLLVDQAENVSSLGPFAQLTWAPDDRLQTSVGVRWDRNSFKVKDNFLRDGSDGSGARTMSAVSGHAGASYLVSARFVPYANVATAFDTPTTTELNARSDGSGGFNPDLNPQRTVTVEAGARGAVRALTYDVSVFRGHTTDAIIQYLETNGRAYFQNAGSTNSTGAELGLHAPVTRWLAAELAYTYAHYVFGQYRVPRGAVTDTLDGKHLAGVPDQFVRAGFGARYRAFSLDGDWTWSSALWADDINTLKIPSWGAGRSDFRMSWEGTVAGQRFAPFVALNNAFGQRYVGSVTLNGAFGRVRESAPGQNWYAGLELGWSVLK